MHANKSNCFSYLGKLRCTNNYRSRKQNLLRAAYATKPVQNEMFSRPIIIIIIILLYFNARFLEDTALEKSAKFLSSSKMLCIGSTFPQRCTQAGMCSHWPCMRHPSGHSMTHGWGCWKYGQTFLTLILKLYHPRCFLQAQADALLSLSLIWASFL